jgi:hypothetical protein
MLRPIGLASRAARHSKGAVSPGGKRKRGVVLDREKSMRNRNKYASVSEARRAPPDAEKLGDEGALSLRPADVAPGPHWRRRCQMSELRGATAGLAQSVDSSVIDCWRG